MTNYNLKTYSFPTLLCKILNLGTYILNTQECRRHVMASNFRDYEEWRSSKYFAKYERKLDRLFGYVQLLQDIADAKQFKHLAENENNRIVGALMVVASYKYSM